MGRVCTVCAHPNREEIDKALVGGEAVVSIAARYFTVEGKPLGRMAVQRHKDEHLPQTLAKAETAKEINRADELLAEVNKLKAKAISLLLAAERAGDIRAALAGIREARNCLELLLEAEGELNRAPVVNLTLSVEWQQTRTIILHALSGYPDAQRAVVMALSASTGVA